jgi:hypothetical protein
LFVAVLVMAAVSFQLFRIATAITANWSAKLSARADAPHATHAAAATLAPMAQPSTLNPRIDVLVNALERSTIIRTASGSDIRRQIVSSPALILGGDATTPNNQISVARSSLVGRPASQRAPLKPVRKVA